MRAGILGIGTELTDGQILNRNGQWISQQLKILGISTLCQLVVPDEHDAIMDGLHFCAKNSQLLFITGGLGPTTDDFTRDVVAEWAQSHLVFSDSAWSAVEERLRSRGYEPRAEQKQQCYFPENSKILANRAGTAAGFQFTHHNVEVFVLPGPPSEIAAIWEDFIQPWLKVATKDLDPVITQTWDTLGKGEADVASLTEEVLKNVPVTKGYRVHLPYVEVKTTYPKSKEKDLQPFLKKLDTALAPITVTKNGEDLVEKLAAVLAEKNPLHPIVFHDESHRSALIERLKPFYRSDLAWSFISGTHSQVPLSSYVFTFKMTGPHECEASVQGPEGVKCESFKSPHQTENMISRSRLLLIEYAFNFWAQNV